MIPWRAIAGGVELRVRLTPKSSRDAIESVEHAPDGPALKARVTAVPEDGKANTALIQLVAKWIGVAKSTVAITSGPKSRIKTLTISGDAAVLTDTISRRIAELS